MRAKHILFVDDEECIAESSAELLEEQGFVVTSATSSREALEIFRANPQEFDLVFTDLTMPEMSGMELAAEMLRARDTIPIVLCSGFGSELSEAEVKAAGLRALCVKPLGMKRLGELACALINKDTPPA